ncbi:hypothetical protein HNQ07_002693 [Deinococcus metalli]|uniref:DUF1579 domain-containing protein n=1 Tax=Deinococcus metalli TaxID=1141878 RepID=A0A7W8KG04_9DEIO|nr:hypothetical protein [Deinococcus metalli]MBB5377220.1 hypothetical protein [Deinococcus metalli]GHF48090.1 hypothetical protein GCM10017781_25560 [Deinococcus metalli]
MRRTALTVLAALSTAASAASVTLPLNGQPTAVPTTVIGGVTYVKLADLQRLLAAQGGANQKASVSGCVNEWLFNGIWRMRVTKVAPVQDQYYGNGWGVTIELKNGTTQTMRMDDAGIKYNGAVNVTFADGDSWAKSWRSGWQDKTYAKLPQGTGTVYTFAVFPEEKMAADAVQAMPAQKFLLDIEPTTADGVKAKFSVADPSFRVDLTCRK